MTNAQKQDSKKRSRPSADHHSGSVYPNNYDNDNHQRPSKRQRTETHQQQQSPPALHALLPRRSWGEGARQTARGGRKKTTAASAAPAPEKTRVQPRRSCKAQQPAPATTTAPPSGKGTVKGRVTKKKPQQKQQKNKTGKAQAAKAKKSVSWADPVDSTGAALPPLSSPVDHGAEVFVVIPASPVITISQQRQQEQDVAEAKPVMPSRAMPPTPPKRRQTKPAPKTKPATTTAAAPAPAAPKRGRVKAKASPAPKERVRIRGSVVRRSETSYAAVAAEAARLRAAGKARQAEQMDEDERIWVAANNGNNSSNSAQDGGLEEGVPGPVTPEPVLHAEAVYGEEEEEVIPMSPEYVFSNVVSAAEYGVPSDGHVIASDVASEHTSSSTRTFSFTKSEAEEETKQGIKGEEQEEDQEQEQETSAISYTLYPRRWHSAPPRLQTQTGGARQQQQQQQSPGSTPPKTETPPTEASVTWVVEEDLFVDATLADTSIEDMPATMLSTQEEEEEEEEEEEDEDAASSSGTIDSLFGSSSLSSNDDDDDDLPSSRYVTPAQSSSPSSPSLPSPPPRRSSSPRQQQPSPYGRWEYDSAQWSSEDDFSGPPLAPLLMPNLGPDRDWTHEDAIVDAANATLFLHQLLAPAVDSSNTTNDGNDGHDDSENDPYEGHEAAESLIVVNRRRVVRALCRIPPLCTTHLVHDPNPALQDVPLRIMMCLSCMPENVDGRWALLDDADLERIEAVARWKPMADPRRAPEANERGYGIL
ncbi:hypothetical protein N3K66_002754 [Trichothecium roseum]|uniref:Uncharacterized protein n=1 Tax=Trichothecium roseum TaxID=47278 RepID=A0ACC0VAD9_9HYPO|nr:hypothetical protein N3K66_002754 [Trichothecium roseum]